jgi:hypothetical protein
MPSGNPGLDKSPLACFLGKAPLSFLLRPSALLRTVQISHVFPDFAPPCDKYLDTEIRPSLQQWRKTDSMEICAL